MDTVRVKSMAKSVRGSRPMGAVEKAVWSELPEDMLTKILAKLPVVSLLRSRAVCREWNKAGSGPQLLQERKLAGAGEQECMLLVVAGCRSCFYDPTSYRWYKVQLPPSWVGGLTSESDLPPASASEMVCIPHLWNPVARSWACVPALPAGLEIRHVRGLWVDPSHRCFKLVAVKETRYTLGMVRPDMTLPVPTFVFDSAVGRWSLTTSAMEAPDEWAILEDSSEFVQGVFVGSALYCLGGRHKCCLLAYHLERASWSFLDVAKPPVPDLWVFECKGPINVRDRLLCVAVGFFPKMGYPDYMLCVQVWELDRARTTWTVVAAMPEPMLAGCRGQSLLRVLTPGTRLPDEFNVVARQDEVYIMQNLNGVPPLHVDHEDRMVAVDLRETPAAWRRLPSYPFHEFQDKTCLHSFDPWLHFGSFEQQ